MNLLFDTNILMALSRNFRAKEAMKVINPDDKQIFVSVATIGELKSLALQNNWGQHKLQSLNEIFDEITVVDINENFIDIYVEIDAYSQRRNPRIKDYSFSTPRNMGKNDLWIASTAALLGLKLITTDNDFNHLHDVFLEVECLKPEQLKS